VAGAPNSSPCAVGTCQPGNYTTLRILRPNRVRAADEDSARFQWCSCPHGDHRRAVNPTALDKENAKVDNLRERFGMTALNE
jgi:hypothetical protein